MSAYTWETMLEGYRIIWQKHMIKQQIRATIKQHWTENQETKPRKLKWEENSFMDTSEDKSKE